MRKSNGYILLQDIFIFMICSILLLSAASSWKNAILRRQQYQRISEAVYLLEDYQAGRTLQSKDKVIPVSIATEAGMLTEYQVWENNDGEKMVCNFFRFCSKGE